MTTKVRELDMLDENDHVNEKEKSERKKLLLICRR